MTSCWLTWSSPVCRTRVKISELESESMSHIKLFNLVQISVMFIDEVFNVRLSCQVKRLLTNLLRTFLAQECGR
jgi:hypothetical protein